MKIKLTLFLIFILVVNSSYAQTSGESVDFIYAKHLYNDNMFDLAVDFSGSWNAWL